mgnify:CR=1 FL=1
MAGNISLQICETSDEVAVEAAKLFADIIRAKPDAVIGLATGSTPEQTYEELAGIHKSDGLRFSGVSTFNLDEYLGLNGDHDQSYRYFMNTKLFNKIDIRPWNTNVLNGAASNPSLECQAFETKILASGGIDIWLLGIGGNGHIAFNEPGSPVPYRYYTKLQVKSIITNPVPGEIIPASGYTLAGAAWSGEEDVEKVEISTDGGKTWGPVDTLHPRTGYSWYRWEHRWSPPAEGKYTIMSRATNVDGVTQPMEFPNPWDGRGYGNNMVFPYDVEVRA